MGDDDDKRKACFSCSGKLCVQLFVVSLLAFGAFLCLKDVVYVYDPRFPRLERAHENIKRIGWNLVTAPFKMWAATVEGEPFPSERVQDSKNKNTK